MHTLWNYQFKKHCFPYLNPEMVGKTQASVGRHDSSTLSSTKVSNFSEDPENREIRDRLQAGFERDIIHSILKRIELFTTKSREKMTAGNYEKMYERV